MKIYLLKQKVNNYYDTFSDCVVIAESEQDAITIHPKGSVFQENKISSDWAYQYKDIKVTDIGIAHDDQKRGVICASFHAG